MKKVTVCALALLALPLLGGCSFSSTTQTDTELQAEQQQEIRQGTLERSMMSASAKGTHTLTQSTGQEIYLKSKTENLNLYVDEEVEVRGTLRTDEDGDEIMDVVSIKRAGEEEQMEDISWVTDTYSELGIKLSYPDILQAFANSTAVSFSYTGSNEATEETEQVQITISRDGALGSGSLRSYASAKDRSASFEEIRLGSYEGFRKKSDVSTTMEFYVNHEGTVYRIDFTEENGSQNWKNYFYQMMDSLEFGVEEELPSELEEDMTSREDSPAGSAAPSSPSSASTSSSSSTTTSGNTGGAAVTSGASAGTASSSGTNTGASSAPAASSVGTNAQQQVASYVSGNVASLGLGSNVKISGYSFVDPNYVYVTYSDGDTRKKVLYQYSVKGSTVTTSQVGSFVAGEERSWETVEGANPVANEQQQVYSVGSSGSITEKATVKSGYRLFESGSQGYTIQIPSSWYYRGMGGSLNFSNQPVEEDNVQSSLSVKSGSVSGSNTSIGGQPGKVEYSTDAEGKQTVTVSVQGEDGKVYSVSGAASEEATFKTMLETLETK